jgi:hypothetical protein
VAAGGSASGGMTFSALASGEVAESGSHEEDSQSWSGWFFNKARAVGNFVATTAKSVATNVGRELSLLPGTIENMPSAVSETFQSGEAIDSFAGAVDGAAHALADPLGIRLDTRGPIFGNEQAFANGRIVGAVGVLVVETTAFVAGAVGLALAAPPLAFGWGVAGLGVASLTVTVDAAAAGTIAANGTLALGALYMAVNTAGNLPNQRGSGGPPAPKGQKLGDTNLVQEVQLRKGVNKAGQVPGSQFKMSDAEIDFATRM